MGEAWKLGYTGNNILILQSEADSSETLKLPTSFTVVATTIDGQFSSSSYAGIVNMLPAFEYVQKCSRKIYSDMSTNGLVRDHTVIVIAST